MLSLRRVVGNKLGFNPLSWIAYARRLRARIEEFDWAVARPPGALSFGVVVTPWVGSGVPLFSLMTGLLLAARGNRVTFILDDMPFSTDRLRRTFILRCLRHILKAVRKALPVIDLAAVPGTPLTTGERAHAQSLAELNAVWALRGEAVEAGRNSLVVRYRSQLLSAYDRIKTVCVRNKFDVLFVPGGVYGSSGIWAAKARESGFRVASYDNAGYGGLMLASDGIACQMQDIPRAFAVLKSNFRAGEEDFVLTAAREEMARRRAGTDTFRSQVTNAKAIGSQYDGGVLIALNSSWDSSALGLHAVFGDSQQWIVETVRHLLENTDAPVIVRQHPAERLDYARTTDNYADLLCANFGGAARLHFIAAQDPINSYDLLQRVRAMVVYTSTIGTEAAIEGKPVVTPSDSYYSDLGFVWKARNLHDYRTYLTAAARGELVVTPQQQNDATICYYLTQCMNWVFSPFNPADTDEWMKLGFAAMLDDDKIKLVMNSLEEGLPVALLNHRAAASTIPS